jgi:NTE family protein
MQGAIPATTTSKAGPADAKIAFVLGGGGHMGAAEVGMLAALDDQGIRPDVIVGTSVGALNGAAFAAAPGAATVRRLQSAWIRIVDGRLFSESLLQRASMLVRTRTHVHSNEPLRALIEELLPIKMFDELVIPFQCVAACVERAAEHWFTEGSLCDAILASSAVPGLLPPVEIKGEHFLDGGLVNSIPIDRAVMLGSTELYVLHVGRIQQRLLPPRNPWEVAALSFEIARRHRFAHELDRLPSGVVAHVLPTGDDDGPGYTGFANLRYRDFSSLQHRIEQAYNATSAYLEARR